MGSCIISVVFFSWMIWCDDHSIDVTNTVPYPNNIFPFHPSYLLVNVIINLYGEVFVIETRGQFHHRLSCGFSISQVNNFSQLSFCNDISALSCNMVQLHLFRKKIPAVFFSSLKLLFVCRIYKRMELVSTWGLGMQKGSLARCHNGRDIFCWRLWVALKRLCIRVQDQSFDWSNTSGYLPIHPLW